MYDWTIITSVYQFGNIYRFNETAQSLSSMACNHTNIALANYIGRKTKIRHHLKITTDNIFHFILRQLGDSKIITKSSNRNLSRSNRFNNVETITLLKFNALLSILVKPSSDIRWIRWRIVWHNIITNEVQKRWTQTKANSTCILYRKSEHWQATLWSLVLCSGHPSIWSHM